MLTIMLKTAFEEWYSTGSCCPKAITFTVTAVTRNAKKDSTLRFPANAGE